MINSEYVNAFNTMGESGIYWIDLIFKICVIALVDLAYILGITYEEVNVWLFVIIWPVLTVGMGAQGNTHKRPRVIEHMDKLRGQKSARSILGKLRRSQLTSDRLLDTGGRS